MGEKQRKREQALSTKKDICARKVQNLYDEIDDKMKKSETGWLNRSAGWIHKAERKIKSKKEDDEAKEEGRERTEEKGQAAALDLNQFPSIIQKGIFWHARQTNI